MGKHSVSLLLLLVSIAPLGTVNAATAANECWALSHDRAGFSACLNDLKQHADTEFAALFQDELAGAEKVDEMRKSSKVSRAVRAAHKAFERYRERECKARRLLAAFDAKRGDVFVACWVDITRNHMDVLRVQAGAGMAGISVGSSWDVEQISGTPLPAGVTAIIRFDAGGKVTGKTGCNTFSAAVSLGDGEIRFSDINATRRTCPTPAGRMERLFLYALDRSRGLALSNGELELNDADGNTVMRLRRVDDADQCGDCEARTGSRPAAQD